MSSTQGIQKFIETIFPLYRSICSPGLDEALIRIQKNFIPDLKIEKYPTSSKAWTWDLPKKWDLKSGFIEVDGKKIIHTDQEPLSVISGSLPVDKEVSYEELLQHVYSEAERPDLLCWNFKYYGKLDWGFNLPHSLVKSLNPKSKYKVCIDAKYYDDSFQVGTVFLKGESDKIVLITADICHPFQCNDSLSGAAVAYELYKSLSSKKDRYYSYLFNFVPETIGTIAYLSNHEDLIPRIVYHIYTEFWGNDGIVHFQQSLKGDSVLDQIISSVLRSRFSNQFKVLPYRQDGVINDEIVTTMPNLFIPSVALNRGMYYEYHSHKDIPSNLNYENIREGFEIMADVLEKLEKTKAIDFDSERGSINLQKLFPVDESSAQDFIPVPLFKGPIFLSKYDLWVDWRIDPAFNEAVDMIMISLDGKNSVSQIAKFSKLSFDQTKTYLERFEAKGLISRKTIKDKALCNSSK